MSLNELMKQVEGLPEDQKKVIENYIHQVIEETAQKKNAKPFEFKWEGGLEDLKSRFTSVELQHRSWGEDLKTR